MRRAAAMAAAAALLAGGCAAPHVQDTGRDARPSMALRAVEARSFAVAKRAAFDASMGVAQDEGCTISAADYEAGFLTARGPSPEHEAPGCTRTITAVITQASPTNATTVRLTISDARPSPVTWPPPIASDPRPYRRLFDRIAHALFSASALPQP